MRVSDATLRRLAFAMPVAYAALSVASLPLAAASGTPVEQDLALLPVFFLYALIGALVAAREPRNPVGWLLGVSGLCAALAFFSGQYGAYATITAPGALPAEWVATWLSLWIWMGMLAALLYAVMLLPSGHLPSPRWRPAAWTAGFVLTLVGGIFAFGSPVTGDRIPLPNPLWLPALEPLYRVADAGFVIFVALFGLAVASLVVRYRRSRGVERQQLKWIVAAGAMMVATLAAGLVWELDWAWIASVLALPLSIGVAILRYRLYDIDVLINRTLVYAAVIASLVATYFGAVIMLQALLRPITSGSDLAVAGSTLLVVAIFQPLRRRVQDAVDRRFYRSRYDAARTIDAFAARLRDEVDLDEVRADLLRVAADTLRPAHASVWLREPER